MPEIFIKKNYAFMQYTVVFPQRGACSTSLNEITLKAKSSFSHSVERVVLVFIKLDWRKKSSFSYSAEHVTPGFFKAKLIYKAGTCSVSNMCQ